VEVGQGVIWDRFAPVLRGLVENSNGFRTAMEAFRSKISGRYFVTCANVRYPPFQSGQFTYSVIDQMTMGSERDHFAGVTIEQDGKRVAVLPCEGVATLNVQALAETLKNL